MRFVPAEALCCPESVDRLPYGETPAVPGTDRGRSGTGTPPSGHCLRPAPLTLEKWPVLRNGVEIGPSIRGVKDQEGESVDAVDQ